MHRNDCRFNYECKHVFQKEMNLYHRSYRYRSSYDGDTASYTSENSDNKRNRNDLSGKLCHSLNECDLREKLFYSGT